jgi:hypothetical protein
MPFRSYKLTGMSYDETSKCYFEDRSHFEEAQKLWLFACPVCDKACERPFASLSNLKKHLKTHHMYYWYVCTLLWVRYRFRSTDSHVQHRSLLLSDVVSFSFSASIPLQRSVPAA